MVAKPDAVKSCYSVNHGAGRCMGRKAAARTLNQTDVNADFETHDILYDARQYSIDEAPNAYKDFKGNPLTDQKVEEIEAHRARRVG